MCGGGVADSESGFAGGVAESDEEMGFAGAGVADEDDGIAGADVAAGGEGGDEGGLNGGGGVEVEVGESFDARELGVVYLEPMSIPPAGFAVELDRRTGEVLFWRAGIDNLEIP